MTRPISQENYVNHIVENDLYGRTAFIKLPHWKYVLTHV